jgi:predicted  nucleic acid-binding Zn-ribbon protein
MEEQEPLDAQFDELSAEQAEVTGSLETLRVKVTEAEKEIEADLAEAVPQRAREAAGLPPDLAERYERLRTRLKGTGAARLIGNRCDGCHLELPSVEVDRIRHLAPDEVVTCDQCGRILVRAG